MAKNKSKYMNIRLTDDELQHLRQAAAEANLRLSDYVRRTLLSSSRPAKLPLFEQGEELIRTERLNVRFTPSEKAWIEQCAVWFRCRPPEAVRRILFTEHAFNPIVLDTALLDKTYLEVHKQGVNLNQLMTYLNTYKANADTSMVSDVLQKVHEQLNRLNAVVDDFDRQKQSGKKHAGF